MIASDIVWVRASLIECHSIEESLAQPVIRSVVRFFIAFAPIGIVLTLLPARSSQEARSLLHFLSYSVGVVERSREARIR